MNTRKPPQDKFRAVTYSGNHGAIEKFEHFTAGGEYWRTLRTYDTYKKACDEAARLNARRGSFGTAQSFERVR